MSEQEWIALKLSIHVAMVAVAISLPVSICMAWLLARKAFAGKTLIETAINLPLVLPPVVTGYLLLRVFGRQGVLGQILEDWLGFRLVFDWKGAVVASAVAAFPLMVRTIRLSIAHVNRRLEDAARTLGAGPFDVFLSITMPLAWRGVASACVLGFARSLGEFGATAMIAGNIPGETQTVSLYIYTQLETPGGVDRVTAIILISIAVAACALLAGELLERQNGGLKE